MKDDIGGVWRTIGGRRVFIKNGQRLSDAMKESGKFKQSTNEKMLELARKKDEEVDKISSTLKLSKREHEECNKILKEYKNNKNENLSIIDKSTFEDKGKINSSNQNSSVGFSDEQIEIMNNSDDRSLIAIHNHPGNSTFSINDIYTCLEYSKLGGIMVVTEDYVYSLKPKFYQNTFNSSEIKQFEKWFENKLSDENDNLLSKYPHFSNNQLQHIAYKEIFDELEWEYGREKRKKD